MLRNSEGMFLLLLCLGVIKLVSSAVEFHSTWWTQPISFMFPVPDDVSEMCKRHTSEYLSNIQSQSRWALKMMDASGRLQSGLLSSNIRSLGSFDECLDVKHPYHTFSGKYCLLKLDFGTGSNFTFFISKIREIFHYYLEELHTGNPHPLKFFPTFLVGKWALCLPSSCSANDVNILGKTIFHRATKNMNLNASILLEDHACSTAFSKRPYGSFEYIALTIFVITVMMIVASTLIGYFFKKDRRRSTFSKVVSSFSIIDSWNQWLELKSTRSTQFLEGIRVLCSLSIVMKHEELTVYSTPYLNLEKLIKATYNYTYTPLWFTHCRVDVLFLLSGLLRSYGLIKRYDQGEFEVIKPIVRRYLRLTPTYLFVILFYGAVFDRIDNGPEWYTNVSYIAKSCRTSWWKNLLYINNYFHPRVLLNFSNNMEKTCVSQTWYLGMDMQMFVISPLVIYPLWKWDILGKSIMLLLLIASLVAPLAAFRSIGFEGLQLFYEGSESSAINYYYYMYFQTYTRACPYLVGIVMGFILRRRKTIIMEKWIMKMGWLTCFLVLFLYIYGPIFLPCTISTFLEKLQVGLYESFGRLIFSIAIARIIYACNMKNDGMATRFLSCNIFAYLSKISYSIYLVHHGMFYYTTAIMKTLQQAESFIVIRNIVGDFGMVLFIALLLHILIEIPFSKVTGLLFVNSDKKSKTEILFKKIHDI